MGAWSGWYRAADVPTVREAPQSRTSPEHEEVNIKRARPRQPSENRSRAIAQARKLQPKISY
jgi:hypothetical protein